MSEQQTEEQVISPEEQVISEAKEKLAEVVPTPPEPTPVSSAQALKGRLDWGEPALTIIDARDREAYLEERITGAMLVSDVNNLAPNRDIYVYGNNEEETAKAASDLRQAGFNSVSQLQGNLAGWKAIGGATEGRVA